MSIPFSSLDRNAIPVFLFVLTSLGINANAGEPTSNATGSPPVDTAELAQRFNDVFKNDFEVVSQRVARDEFDLPWWVVEVRPRKAGFFVVRYEAEVDRPHDPQKRDRVRYEFYLSVGESGAPRILNLISDETHPLACVGDTLLLPIDVKPQLCNFHFYNAAADPRVAKIWSDYERSGPAELREQFARKAEFDLDNGMAENLAVVSTTVNSAVTRSGASTHHSFNGLFEARNPGNFNLFRIVDGRVTGESLSMRVVPKSDAIAALVLHASHFDFTGAVGSETVREALSRKPAGTATARVGDLVAIGLAGQVTPGRGAPSTQPILKLERRPFEAQPQPFGVLSSSPTTLPG